MHLGVFKIVRFYYEKKQFTKYTEYEKLKCF